MRFCVELCRKRIFNVWTLSFDKSRPCHGNKWRDDYFNLFHGPFWPEIHFARDTRDHYRESIIVELYRYCLMIHEQTITGTIKINYNQNVHKGTIVYEENITILRDCIDIWHEEMRIKTVLCFILFFFFFILKWKIYKL